MKTGDGERTTLKAGDAIIFREEGTVNFHRLGNLLLFSSGDDRVYLGKEVTKDKELALNLAQLIAQSHGLKATGKEYRQGHLTFNFVED